MHAYPGLPRSRCKGSTVSRQGAAGRCGLQWGSSRCLLLLSLMVLLLDGGSGWIPTLGCSRRAATVRVSFMDFVGHAWRMASAWRLRLHDGRSFERDRHGLMVLLAHVFVRSLEASLDAMGVVFDGAVSLRLRRLSRLMPHALRDACEHALRKRDHQT